MAPSWRVLLEKMQAKGLRWSLIARFMSTRISQAAATIPLIGYALLWSEKLAQYFELSRVLGSGMWFDPVTRLLGPRRPDARRERLRLFFQHRTSGG